MPMDTSKNRSSWVGWCGCSTRTVGSCTFLECAVLWSAVGPQAPAVPAVLMSHSARFML